MPAQPHAQPPADDQEPPPPSDLDAAWEDFTRALILERYGRTCPELSRAERAQQNADARPMHDHLDDHLDDHQAAAELYLRAV